MRALGRRALAPLLSVALCGIVLTVWACTPAATAVPSALNGASLEPAVTLPPLTLARSDGGAFNTDDTRGRTSLFFFGYTYCPDVCPLTLAQFVQIREKLGPGAASIDMYFVTLDPDRDTPARMQAYMPNFPGVVGLTGSDFELAGADSAFNVVTERRDLGNGEYAVDHTAAAYLVNSASQIQLAYAYGTPAEDIVSDLRTFVSKQQSI